MKKVQLHLINLLIFITVAFFLSCNTSSTGYNSEDSHRQLNELEKIMDVKFPEGSKIVNEVSNKRNGESATRHIIFSPSPVEFNVQPVAEITPDLDIDIIKKHVSLPGNLGSLKDQQTFAYEGDVGKGEWHASQTNFENGSYLIVEQIHL